MDRCVIKSIKPTGTCGMYKATIDINDHGAAIEVLGINLTECVERAYKVYCTFKEDRKWIFSPK